MRQNPPLTPDDFYRQGSPSGLYAENMPATGMLTDCAAPTTQVMLSVGVPLQAGDVVTNISFLSGATAAGTPTNWWFALYSNASTPALLSQTADQLTTAWAADTVMTVALATPQTITVGGWYYAAVMMKATTVATFMGATLGRAAAAGAVAGSKVLARTSGSGLTTTAPATIASPTTVATVPRVVLT